MARAITRKELRGLIDEQSKQETNEVVKSSFCLGSFIFY
jgi:hypothetical protein